MFMHYQKSIQEDGDQLWIVESFWNGDQWALFAEAGQFIMLKYPEMFNKDSQEKKIPLF